MNVPLREIAQRLIGFDTTSDRNNAPAMDYAAELLERAGFSIHLNRYHRDGVEKTNLLAQVGPPEPPGLMISGHMDTVPFDNQSGWTRDPLNLEVDDEWVYGRGTSDMKVFLAQTLDAVQQLRRNDLKRPLLLAFTADEEVGSQGAAHLVDSLEDLLAPYAKPGWVWIGEPSSWEIYRSHKGYVCFSIQVLGKSGHSSTPENGANAITVMGKIIDTIGRYQQELVARPAPEYGDLFPHSAYPTLNFGTIRGGTALNMIPDECRLEISYRPLPDGDPLDIFEEIRRRVNGLSLQDYSGSPEPTQVSLNPVLAVPPLPDHPGTPLEEALRRSLSNTHPATGAPFFTDGCHFNEAGIIPIICGPGDLKEAHQPNERISRQAFESGTQTVVSTFRHLCMEE